MSVNLRIEAPPPVQLAESQQGGIYQRVVNWLAQRSIVQFAQNLGRRFVWAWSVTVDTLKKEGVIITVIFFAIFAGFGMAIAIQSAVIYSLAKFSVAISKDRGLVKTIQQLQDHNQTLHLKVDKAVLEKNGAVREGDKRIQILSKKNQKLLKDREKLAREKRELDETYLKTADELHRLQAQMAQIQRFKNLHATLDEFGKISGQGKEKSVRQEVLHKLIPECAKHRKSLHTVIRERMDQLNPENPLHVELNAILKLSTEEGVYIERIAKALILSEAK